MIGGPLVAAFLIVAGLFGMGPQTAAGKPAQSCRGANLHPDEADAAAVVHATVCLIDEVRAAHRLHRLRANVELQEVAAAQVAEMVRWDYFADDRPSGQTPLALIASTRYGARAASVSAGQNIGWAKGATVTPRDMVAAWMSSAPHRKIILTPGFRAIGVGVAAVLPPSLGQGRAGAVYAIELATRVLSRRSGGTARAARHAAGLGASL